ncbi:unnamed protein product [Acanthosepion pharaonis]|uniref:Uncharacterized protein n=1 Tax=Acanthosepion pharaonis TaxID=158019 RepID=A0A812CLN0_ACAPH|nr:unnamed protein product [Sepia pharaonis]
MQVQINLSSKFFSNFSSLLSNAFIYFFFIIIFPLFSPFFYLIPSSFILFFFIFTFSFKNSHFLFSMFLSSHFLFTFLSFHQLSFFVHFFLFFITIFFSFCYLTDSFCFIFHFSDNFFSLSHLIPAPFFSLSSLFLHIHTFPSSKYVSFLFNLIFSFILFLPSVIHIFSFSLKFFLSFFFSFLSFTHSTVAIFYQPHWSYLNKIHFKYIVL